VSHLYSSWEKKISAILSKCPWLKKQIKINYSKFVYRKRRKTYSFKSDYKITVVHNSIFETFFGYYDKKPVSDTEKKFIFHISQYTSKRSPKKNSSISIALLSDKLSVPFLVATSSYNWQQGSRALWLDSRNFIFNDFCLSTKDYISRVFNADNQMEVKRFDLPVQDAFKKDYFLSLNYRRLMSLRPDYGYGNLPPLSRAELSDVENDGIWRVEFDSGRHKLLISLAEMCAVAPKPEFAQAFHKVNHVMISPSGKKFIFLHRYYLGRRRFDRLMLADAGGGKMRLLSDRDMVSHCCWVDDNAVLGYLRGPGDKDAYWVIDVASGDFSHVANGALDSYGDGHPHVHGDWFVTDTYPDKARMQHLLLCNWKTGEVRELGEFFHGFEYSGESRCDLHPRFSPDGKRIFFDSVFDGKRRLYVMDLES